MIDHGASNQGLEKAIRASGLGLNPANVKIGDRVTMTFRRLYTAGTGVHDYFWKARPIKESD